jgi:hypothetical protein
MAHNEPGRMRFNLWYGPAAAADKEASNMVLQG